MPVFEYRYTIGFEETNLVGNVYYANHIRWQGRVRELFLHEHAPEMLDLIHGGLALVTLRVSCEYFRELTAFDVLVIRMRLSDLSAHRMSLTFEYWLQNETASAHEEREVLAARGEQELACMMRRDGKVEPEPWPPVLRDALRPYLTDH